MKFIFEIKMINKLDIEKLIVKELLKDRAMAILIVGGKI